MRTAALLHHRPRHPAAGGFTAIELMVTVAVLAVLMALAAPSFNPILERWRVRQAADGLESALYFARSEAIKRGGNVLVEKLPNGTNGCTAAGTTADWGCGWQVCNDANGNGSCQASEVLQRFDAPARIEVTRTSSGASIKLSRWGTVSGTFVGFSLVPEGKSTTDVAARGVCMSSGGRVRVILPVDIPCTS